MNITVDLYKDILPKLSDFLHVENDKKHKGKKNQEGDIQFKEMLKSGN